MGVKEERPFNSLFNYGVISIYGFGGLAFGRKCIVIREKNALKIWWTYKTI